MTTFLPAVRKNRATAFPASPAPRITTVCVMSIPSRWVLGCSVHGQHARAESAVTRRRLGAGLARRRLPYPEQCLVLVPGGRLGNGVAAALYIASVWLLACGVAGGRGVGQRGGRRAAGPGRRLAVGPPGGRSPAGAGVAGLPKLALMPAGPGAETPAHRLPQFGQLVLQPRGLLTGAWLAGSAAGGRTGARPAGPP